MLEDAEQCQWPGQGPIKGKFNAKQILSSCQSSLSKYAPWIRNLNNPQYIFHAPQLAMTMHTADEFFSHFLKQCVNVRTLTLDIVFPSTQFYCVYKVIANILAPNL